MKNYSSCQNYVVEILLKTHIFKSNIFSEQMVIRQEE